MKIKFNTLFFISVLTTINLSFSQQNNSLDQSYIDYFSLEREVPYLHLNKTCFLVGEEIWFKSYIFNLNKKRLRTNANNLYVSIYDKNGNVKDTKLVYIEKGVGAGNFKIDSTFTEKEYYIKATTNWSKNFIEDESYLQKINIITEKSKKKKEVDLKYDIQFLPESGHMLTSIENTLGIIIKDNNSKGVQIKEGKIFDDKKNLTAIFKTNSFGLGSVDFIYDAKKKYSAELIFFDDTKITKEIPIAKNIGVTLSVYNPSTTFISIYVKTNKSTLPNLIGKEYSLLIHNITKSIKQVFTFNKDATEYTINLNSKKLERGVNIVTVFDEKNNPIAERLFFNYHKSMVKKPLISISKSSSDSLFVAITKKSFNNETYYLSASILPEATKANNPKSNIASKFLLEPFVNGQIERSSYYFRDINRKKLMNLDLLLLTQGWSKFKWVNIFNNPPKANFKNEKGITITGFINSNSDATTVFLKSPENQLTLIQPIENKKFKFEYLYLKENSKISLSTKQGKKIKQDQIYLQFSPTKTLEKIAPIKTNLLFNISEPEIDFDSFIGKSIQLDEITVTSQAKKARKRPVILGAAKSYKIDENSQKNLRILAYLRNSGFLVNETGNFSIFNNRGRISLQNTRPVEVFMDNIRMQDEFGNSSLFQLEFLTLRDFEEVIISKTAFGVIHLFTRPDFYTGKSKNRFSEKNVSFGYAVEKEYYQPQYANYYDSFFTNFGAINWNPKITINSEKNRTSYKIINLNKKEVKIFLEGITSEGKIIFEEKVIKL